MAYQLITKNEEYEKIRKDQAEANPVGQGSGYNFRQNIPVPGETAIRAKEQIQGFDWVNADVVWGGEHVNRYWDGITKAELWTGIQKLKYQKDGTWNGYNADSWDFMEISGKATINGPCSQDSQHPRMASGARYVGFHNEGDHEVNYANCHRKINRFFVCALDLPQKAAWSYCKKEFLDYKTCMQSHHRYAANQTEVLAKQLATFSKGINDEYFDLTSATAFNYGDIHWMHRVGQEEQRWGSRDWMRSYFHESRLF